MIRVLGTLSLLALALFAVFHGVLLRGETLLDSRDLYFRHPWSTLAEEYGVEPLTTIDTDPLNQFVPIRHWEARELREGRWPLWCDDVLGGFPHHADANTGLLEPTKLLLLVLPPTRAWEAGIALRLILGFLLMRMFLRGRGLGEPAAALGSLLYLFGALPAFWMRHDHYLWVHALVPLVAHLAERHGETGKLRHAAFAGAAAAVALLGGAAQYGGVLILVGAAWILVRRGPRGIPALGVYLFVAVGMSMAVWWPAMGWLDGCARDTAADAVFWFPPWHLPTLVAPQIFEDPAGSPWRYFLPRSAQTVFGLAPVARSFYSEATVSVGAVGFLLILVAWRRCRGTWARAYRNAGMLLLLGTMLGPLLPILAPGFPMTGLGRLNLLTTFALAALAAKGFHDLVGMSPPDHEDLRAAGARALRWLAIGAVLLLALAGAAWAGRELIERRWGDLLTGELPPAGEIVSHFTGPAILIPLFGLLAGGILIFGRSWRRLSGPVYVSLIVGVAAVEVVVPAMRVNRSWPAEWAYPAAAEALLPPSDVRILPLGRDVLPDNTALAHGRRSALGYLSAWPEDYAQALHGDGPGNTRNARVEDGERVDVDRLLVDGTYDASGWHPIVTVEEPGVRPTSYHPGWRAFVGGSERAVVRHQGWAMRVEPAPAAGQDVEWVFTAPRLRLGLMVGIGTGVLTVLGLLVGAAFGRRP